MTRKNEKSRKIITTTKKIFINLTNHPSPKWLGEQKSEAEKFGEIMDWNFPPINPQWDKADIDNLADKYANNIIQMLNNGTEITLHLMGETSFVVALYKRLMFFPLRIVVSTTERIVCEKNGSKEAMFKFCKFRQIN